MTPAVPDPGQEKNGKGRLSLLTGELKRESERLRRLADELEAREQADEEMRTNYPIFKKLVYTWLREEFERELGPLPEKDLETMIAEEGGMPFEALMRELEQGREGRRLSRPGE